MNECDVSILTFKEQDATGVETGGFAEIEDVDFVPLQYSDLIGKRLNERLELPLRWKNGRIIEGNLLDLEIGGIATGDATLECVQTLNALALVDGGWLPPTFALKNNPIVFLDRCAVEEIKSRYVNGIKRDGRPDDFLDGLLHKRRRFNPMLSVLEGNKRENPTEDVVLQQLIEVSMALRRAIPNALLPLESDAFLNTVNTVIQNTYDQMKARVRFLMSVAPSIQHPISARNRQSCWNRVLQTADQYGVTRKSLVVFAVLSAVLVPNGEGITKKIIKPKSGYTEEDAYNALADIRSLEMFLVQLAAFPDNKPILLTRDKNLALFWAAARPFAISLDNGVLKFSLTVNEHLFPNMSPEQAKLFRDTI